MHKTDRSYATDEWQMTLLRGLTGKYNLVNGYAVEPLIPPGSTVYVSGYLLPDYLVSQASARCNRYCFGIIHRLPQGQSNQKRGRALWRLVDPSVLHRDV